MSPKQINKLDANDELSGKRALFSLPEGIIYLNGNSLGPLPCNVQQRLDAVISGQWGKDLISSWNKHGWIDLPLRVGEKIAPMLGAPSFVYINTRHHDQFIQPLQGWMGHKTPFEFDPNFTPAEGIGQFMTGTPPILSLAALDAALDVFADVDVKQLREKSMVLAEYFLKLVERKPVLRDLQLTSPKQAAQRGGQLSFAHPEAYAICRAWADVGVIADFRSPDLLRVGFSPLILCFEEIERSVQTLFEVMHNKTFSEARFHQHLKVT